MHGGQSEFHQSYKQLDQTFFFLTLPHLRSNTLISEPGGRFNVYLVVRAPGGFDLNFDIFDYLSLLFSFTVALVSWLTI